MQGNLKKNVPASSGENVTDLSAILSLPLVNFALMNVLSEMLNRVTEISSAEPAL